MQIVHSSKIRQGRKAGETLIADNCETGRGRQAGRQAVQFISSSVVFRGYE